MPTISVKDANGTPQTVPLNPVTGTAGTPSTEVVSVQGVASGTVLPVSLKDVSGTTLTMGAQTPANSMPTVPPIATASGNITTQNLVPAGAATAGSAVEITLSGCQTLGIQVTGTYTGALSLQTTIDGTNWVTVGGTPFLNVNTGTYLATITSALQSVFQAEVGGFLKARVTGLAAMTGTAVVTIQAITGASMVSLDSALPAGSAIIGSLAANQSCNVAQIAGVAPDMNAGAASANTLRVALATNSSTNVAQMNGVAVSMGSGVNGTGVQRVSLATDQAALTVAGLISVKLDQTTVGTTNGASISAIGSTAVVNGGLAGTLAIGGAAAHSAATTTNPVTTGGRVVPTTTATVDATLVAGDACHVPMATGYQVIEKPYGTAELDWAAIASFTPTVWASAATLTQLRAASGTANVRTYISAMQIETDALGAADSLWILDGAQSISSATVATPGVFTSGTHDLKVGDAIVLQSLATLAITGVSANQVVWVVTVPSSTTFTIALTPGGTGVQVTASGTATFYRILHQARLQTAALNPTQLTFPSPLRTAPNVALSAIASGTTTGTIYVNAQGYYGF